MWYEDLSHLDYFGEGLEDDSCLRAVGWIEGYRFPTGVIEQRHFDHLAQLLKNPWQPVMCMGSHSCALCQFSGGPTFIEHDGTRIHLGASNLFLPAGSTILVAPSLILHYIDSHRYKPPDVFLTALDNAPESTHSRAYKKAYLKSGGRGLVPRSSE
jgi:hypothetical protein